MPSFICRAAEYSYPVKFVRITSLFGESRGTHFHSGIDFAGAQPIFPISDGKILLAIDREADPRYPAIGPGNTVIIQHEEGFRSYYYHLKDNSVVKEVPPEANVKKEWSIGTMGASGYSTGEHLHLEVEDIQRNLVINPFLILPLQNDPIKPRIVSFLFKIRDKVYRIKKNSRFRYRGPIDLYSIVWDFTSRAGVEENKFKGVKKLNLIIDKKLFQSYDFSLFSKTKNGLAVLSHSPNSQEQQFYSFRQVYGLPFNYRFGEFIPTKSKHHFEIEVMDWQGNKARYAYAVVFL